MDKKTFTFFTPVSQHETLQAYLHPSEQVQFAVKTLRDVAVFTDKRILIADKQGISGKKTEYYSLPFRNIVTYAIETAGTFDLDAEIKLVLAGGVEVELKFLKGKSMNDLLQNTYRLINDYMMSR